MTRDPLSMLNADAPTVRELWQPDRHEQLAACEILLASPIPQELRVLVRDLEIKLATRRNAQ